MITTGDLDEGRLAWVAAWACGVDPLEVLATADVGALARIVADTELAAGPLERASRLLVGIVHQQPFGPAFDRPAAFLAAASELQRVGVRLDMGADDVAVLMNRVARRDIDLAEVTTMLDRCSAYGRRRGSWRCPACARELYVLERIRRATTGRAASAVQFGLMVGDSRYELTSRCAYEHRAHDRGGRAIGGRSSRQRPAPSPHVTSRSHEPDARLYAPVAAV